MLLVLSIGSTELSLTLQKFMVSICSVKPASIMSQRCGINLEKLFLLTKEQCFAVNSIINSKLLQNPQKQFFHSSEVLANVFAWLCMLLV